MISVVLKKGSDYSAFEALLLQQGYSYQIRFKRIFFVECALTDFALSAYADIETCENTALLNIEKHSVDVVESNIGTINPSPAFVEPGLKAWGPHRIIRRKNPFAKEAAAIQRNFTLPYRSQRTGMGVDIYVLDAGINTNHIEFAGGRVIYAGGSLAGATVGDTIFVDALGMHGQNVCSCAGGSITGVARDSQMFFVRIMGLTGTTEAEYLEFFEIAYNHYMSRSGTNRPAIVNMSYGVNSLDTPSAAVTAAFEDMMGDGLIFCISANNTRWDLDQHFIYPAESHPDIVVSGATDAYDLPMWFRWSSGTGIGSGVDIYAPGTWVACAVTDTNDGYLLLSGTSYSSPYTAGVLACMLEGYQRLNSKAQVLSVINKLIANSTQGAMKFGTGFFGQSVVHDRLLYLDPYIAIEPIDGLVTL